MNDPLITPQSYNFEADHIDYIRRAMNDVVNGPGTAGGGRLPFSDIQMAGKTGTAQVVSLSVSDGRTGPWRFRDHGLFTFFAPLEQPRYAGAVVIEHGGGSGSAYPIARDIMTFLFDPAKGMDALRKLEEGWGGTAQERLERKYTAYAAERGATVVPPPRRDEEIFDRVEAEARLAAQETQQIGEEFVAPRPVANPSGTPPTDSIAPPPASEAPE